MSEAVTVPSLTAMTRTVFEEWLVRDTHTETQVIYFKICKVAYDFAHKNMEKSQSMLFWNKWKVFVIAYNDTCITISIMHF